jgi:hypothetical protein
LSRRRLRIEGGDACTQLPVIVPQFPVRLSEALKASAGSPRRGQRGHRDNNSRNGQQPEKGQQTSYLIERLATVSTA